jgi:Flp pilus assembly protein TadG
MSKIINIATRGKALLRRLAADRSGLAFIEFAYSLPILIPLTIYGLEAANLALVNMRVSQIATMVADNSARVRDRIDETDINNILLGAKLSGDSIKILQKGRIVIASVEDNTATTVDTTDAKVVWQRCDGAYAPTSTTTNSGGVYPGGVGVTGNKIIASPNTPLIFVEIYYEVPLLVPAMSDVMFGSNRIIRYSSAFLIRDRNDQTMQNASGLGASNIATCDLFNAT